MSAPTNHWKLGLFVVLSVLGALGMVVFVGARALHREAVVYTSYFDEAVSGLDVGAAVSFRGVKLGHVSAIKVAPDRRHVQVTYELDVAELEHLGLASSWSHASKVRVPRELRVQLASTGITGVKYVQIDFFAPNADSPPELPFPVPANYIPSTPSTLKNIETAATRAADAIPELARAMGAILAQLEGILSEVRREQLPQKLSAALTNTNRVLISVDDKLHDLELKELSNETHTALSKLNGSLDHVNAVLARIDGDKGLVVSVQRASNHIGDVAANVRGLELAHTLTDVREAAQALRALIADLQNDPDMLVKGRAKVSP